MFGQLPALLPSPEMMDARVISLSVCVDAQN